MPNRLLLPIFVQMRIQFLGSEMKMIVQESAKIGGAVSGVCHQFDAITSGYHHPFLDAGIRRQISADIRQARLRDRQPLTQLKRSAVVIHANQLESHEALNLW